LLIRLARPTLTLHPGDGSVERFLRGMEFVHDQKRFAMFGV
jgi:hypothetical protein